MTKKFSRVIIHFKMDKKFIGLVSLFFLSFFLFLTFTIFQEPIAQFTRATEKNLPSANESIILAWPLQLNADGKSQSTINVFVRNEKQVPVSNKKVTLTSTLGQIEETQPISDKQGKTEFKISSTQPGVAEITAQIEGGIILTKKITIEFIP